MSLIYLFVVKRLLSQSSLLDLQDFQLGSQGVTYPDVLGFFNSASEAGASQRHRHMQLMQNDGAVREYDFCLVSYHSDISYLRLIVLIVRKPIFAI